MDIKFDGMCNQISLSDRILLNSQVITLMNQLNKELPNALKLNDQRFHYITAGILKVNYVFQRNWVNRIGWYRKDLIDYKNPAIVYDGLYEFAGLSVNVDNQVLSYLNSIPRETDNERICEMNYTSENAYYLIFWCLFDSEIDLFCVKF